MLSTNTCSLMHVHKINKSIQINIFKIKIYHVLHMKGFLSLHALCLNPKYATGNYVPLLIRNIDLNSPDHLKTLKEFPVPENFENSGFVLYQKEKFSCHILHPLIYSGASDIRYIPKMICTLKIEGKIR